MSSKRSTLVSRIPDITAQASLGIQKAVHTAGEEIEFLTTQGVAVRRRTGREQTKVRWKPDRGGFSGVVRFGTFYSGFSEYGTRHQAARPVIGPAADAVWPRYVADVRKAYD